MGSGYYGIPGYNPDFDQDNDSYYEYEPILTQRNEQVPNQYHETSPAAAAIIFLLGLPFLPIWSGFMILNTLLKISWFETREPAKAAAWKSYLPWYFIFFIAGILMYAILYPIVRRLVMMSPWGFAWLTDVRG